MDEHLESRLREELRRSVDHLQASPGLWQKIRSRHRREPRQRLLAVATSAALLVVVAAAAVPVVRAAADRELAGPTPSVTADQTPLPPGMPDSPPRGWDRRPLGAGGDAVTGPPAVLAQGSTSGRGDWTLAAFPMEGGVCFGFLETPNLVPGVGWCEPTDGVTVSQPRFYPAMGSPEIVTGFVHRDAASILLGYPDGTRESLDSTDQDQGFYKRDGLPVIFYVSLLPPAAQAYPDRVGVRAFDKAGQELETVPPGPTATPQPGPTTTTPAGNAEGDWRPLGLEPATGPLVSVDTGLVSGRRWELRAHPYEDGICAGFNRQPPYWIAGSAWCKPTGTLLGGGAASVTVDGGETLPTFVWGAVRKDAARVRLHLPGLGAPVDVRPIGQDAGFEVNFYVFGILGVQFDRVTVTVYDANGRELR